MSEREPLETSEDYWMRIAGNFRQERDDAAAAADRLHDALRQLVDYVIDGCPEGSYLAVIDAKAALSNIRLVSRS